MAPSISSKHLFLQNYDAILGYRADDSYFAFAKMFLSKKLQRMNKAKEDFHKLIDNYSITEEDLFMTDFILGKVSKNDARLR